MAEREAAVVVGWDAVAVALVVAAADRVAGVGVAADLPKESALASHPLDRRGPRSGRSARGE